MSGMTDKEWLLDVMGEHDFTVPTKAFNKIAARLRDEAAPENVAEDSYHFMADLLAPHVTDTHGGLPGSVVESFQMLLEHWNRTHTAQGEQQAVAWIKPDWSDPKNFDGKSPVTTYPQLGWTPLYIHPQPVAVPDAVRALLAEWRGYKGSIYVDNSIKQDTLADCADELEVALSTQPAPSAPCYPPHDSAECKRCRPDAPSEQVTARQINREFVEGVKQLCRDYSDRQNRPYMGDVFAQLDYLAEQLDMTVASSEQVAASVAVPDEATIDRLAHEAYEIHCNTPIGHFPNDSNLPKWRAVVRHVLAAAPVAPKRENEND